MSRFLLLVSIAAFVAIMAEAKPQAPARAAAFPLLRVRPNTLALPPMDAKLRKYAETQHGVTIFFRMWDGLLNSDLAVNKADSREYIMSAI